MMKPMTTVRATVSGSDMYKGSPEAFRYTMRMPATMNTSPWAKLMRRKMP